MNKLFTLGLVFGAGLVLAGCGGSGSDTIKFGIGGPFTGSDAAFGAQLKQGAEQAIADINEGGGILGKKVSSAVGDDVGDPKQGVSVANNFVTAGVKFVVGHFNSGVSMPASEIYQENNILEITPASTNPKITERNMWNIFRTAGGTTRRGKVAGEYIAKRFKDKKVAVVHDKTTYGRSLADETKKTMNALGVREVLYEGINKGDKDFSAVVSKIKASGADLCLLGRAAHRGRLHRAPDARPGRQCGADGRRRHHFGRIRHRRRPGREGTLMTYGPDPRKRVEARRSSTSSAPRSSSRNPTRSTAMPRCRSSSRRRRRRTLDPKKVAEVMKSGRKFPTVIGDISHDSKGDITRLDYVMYVWKKDASGKITYVEIDQ